MSRELVSVERLDAWVRRFADLVADQCAYLTDLDSAIGDADHGINMDRGMRAVGNALDTARPATADELFKLVGMTLVSSVGGASGPLYGTFFLRLGAACGPRDAISVDDLAKAFRAGVEGLVARGRPELGDKTMYDSLQPALEALDAAVEDGHAPGDALSSAWRAAVNGRDATIPMVARKGRASYLGERSAGHQDPGATSAALLFEAAADVLSSPSEG
ncbi:MAG TPA: dihydroxyacetone kinase subunit DhaL [Acidimicrobiales bacterium]